MTENELIQNVTAMQQGDRNAFTALYYEYYQALYFYLFKLTKDKPTAEDMTQESFITSMEKIGDLKNPAAYKSWLFSIASNCARKHFREQNRFSDFDTDEELEAAFEQAEDYSQGMLVPSDYLENKEVKQRVKQAIDSLPDMQRSAIILFYYENMRIKEIAQALGINENAVNHRLAEGRRAIAKQLSDIRSDNFVFIPLPLMLTSIGKELGLAGGLGAIGAAEAGTTTAAGSAGTAVGTAGVASGTTAAGTASAAAVTAGKFTLGMKIAAAAAAVVVAGSTAAGIAMMNKGDDKEDEDSSQAIVALPAEVPDLPYEIDEPSGEEIIIDEPESVPEDDEVDSEKHLFYRDLFNTFATSSDLYYDTPEDAFKTICNSFGMNPSTSPYPGFRMFKDCNDGTNDVFGSVYYRTDDIYIFKNYLMLNGCIRIDYRANYDDHNAEELNAIKSYEELSVIDRSHIKIYNFSFFTGYLFGSSPDFSYIESTGERVYTNYDLMDNFGSIISGQNTEAVTDLLQNGENYYEIEDTDKEDNIWRLNSEVVAEVSETNPEWIDISENEMIAPVRDQKGTPFELRISCPQLMKKDSDDLYWDSPPLD
ncbi:MAG: RNA polymerase sigma factor [Ruminococcus sp.]|nr:RNA polymerase sigma factor [Ruminococcus sp.]